jgi:hypothetical protein
VIENRAVSEISGPERKKVTGKWRRLHNEELYDLYCPLSIVWVIKSRRMRWARHVAGMRERRVSYRVLVQRPEGKRPLGKPRLSWDDNIKIGIQDV